MSDAGLISAEKLRALTGLSDKELRGIAGKGFYPAPVRRQYQSAPTIFGLFKYYREVLADGQNEAAKIYFDSIASCAAQLDVPVTVLKAAKKKGCPAFKASRVYLLPLVQWILTKPGESHGNENWYEEKAKEQTLRERIKRKKDEQAAADWGQIAFGLNRGTAMLFTRLDKLFSQTLPPELKDLSVLEIKKRLVSHVRPLIEQFRAELLKLGDLSGGEK